MTETEIPAPVTAPRALTAGFRARPNYALAVLFVAYLFSYVDRQILSLLIEPIKRDLQLSDLQIGLLQGWAFSIFYAVMGLPIAALADRGNRKNIVATGIALWSAMTAVCGLATSYLGLFLARIGVGIGEAALTPAGASLLGDLFKPRLLARATAVFMAGVIMGSAMAYLLGGGVMHVLEGMDVRELPVVGALRPWQLTFIIVGLPGLLVALAAALIREPARSSTVRHDAVVTSGVGLGVFLRRKWPIYSSLGLGVTLMTTQGFAFMTWYPTFLIRTHGFSVGETGAAIGSVYLVFGLLGTFVGPYVVERMLNGGRHDAHVRFLYYVAGLMLPCSLGSFLAPNAAISLACASGIVLLKAGYLGNVVAAVQLIAPNELRARIQAIMSFLSGIVGMGLGATSVALFTDFVFADLQAIGYSLACATALSLIGALAALRWCLRHYGAEVAAAGVFNSPRHEVK